LVTILQTPLKQTSLSTLYIYLNPIDILY
jgi:hypothetical protein